MILITLNNVTPMRIAMLAGILALGVVGCAHASKSPVQSTATATRENSETALVEPAANIDATADKVEPPVRVNAMGVSGAVAMEIVPQYNELLDGMAGELSVLIKLDGREVPEVARQPMDLAIVVDRSGSMVGDKLASVKVAALELLRRLMPEDQVTLISYSTDVTVHAVHQLMDAEGIELLRTEILALTADSFTALGPATEQALKILGEKSGDNRLSHVLLLSDGIANVGVADPAALGSMCAEGFKQGVSVSTIGVGLDYNEDVMTKMADEGGGQYHYVRDEKMIVTVLEDELNGLMATVARDMVLVVRGENGFRVKQVFGYAATIDAAVTRIRVGSLRSGQNRDVLLLLDYDSLTSVEGELAPLDLGLQFTDVMNDSAHSSMRLLPTVALTSDEKAAHDSENTEVTVRLAEVQSLEKLKTVAQAVDRGDFDEADQVITQTIDALENQVKLTPDTKLEVQIKELQQAKENLSLAKTSAAEQKNYVKASKSTAYTKSKQTKGRKSTFDKIKPGSVSTKKTDKPKTRPSTPPAPSNTRAKSKVSKQTSFDL
ncbi:MAG: VWA domain-containing protein [Deltaproteobacteria bacterium]|nr:VWA domain-containing protein [Deltaproteobacteria bacterium]